jgi:hypothetical protein
VLPTRQRFDAGGPSGLQVELRKELEEQLIVLDRFAQLIEQKKFLRELQLVRIRKDGDRALRLARRQHGNLRPLHEVVRSATIKGVRGNPDMDLKADLQLFDLKRGG